MFTCSCRCFIDLRMPLPPDPPLCYRRPPRRPSSGSPAWSSTSSLKKKNPFISRTFYCSQNPFFFLSHQHDVFFVALYMGIKLCFDKSSPWQTILASLHRLMLVQIFVFSIDQRWQQQKQVVFSCDWFSFYGLFGLGKKKNSCMLILKNMFVFVVRCHFTISSCELVSGRLHLTEKGVHVIV